MERRRLLTLVAAFATIGAAEPQCNSTTTGISVNDAGAYVASAAVVGETPLCSPRGTS